MKRRAISWLATHKSIEEIDDHDPARPAAGSADVRLEASRAGPGRDSGQHSSMSAKVCATSTMSMTVPS